MFSMAFFLIMTNNSTSCALETRWLWIMLSENTQARLSRFSSRTVDITLVSTSKERSRTTSEWNLLVRIRESSFSTENTLFSIAHTRRSSIRSPPRHTVWHERVSRRERWQTMPAIMGDGHAKMS
jgi:hypothetical protein